jgi:hypothetical protein
MSDNV